MLEESVVYQDILQKGVQIGVGQGVQQGLQQGEQRLVLRLLEQLLGKLSAEIRKRIEALDAERLENLGDALLKFKSERDLTDWLERHATIH